MWVGVHIVLHDLTGLSTTHALHFQHYMLSAVAQQVAGVGQQVAAGGSRWVCRWQQWDMMTPAPCFL
jgi:hypothetical protein